MKITDRLGWLFPLFIAACFFGPYASAQTIVLSETFEGAFPGAWSIGDSNSSGTTAYWSAVDLTTFGTPPIQGSGSHAGYCAGIGRGGTIGSPTYQNSMDAYMSRTIDLTGYDSAALSFWYIIPSLQSGGPDKCRVYVDSTLIFEQTAPVTSWTQSTLDLTPYVHGTHTLRFEFVSDTSSVAEGWYLDDILVTATSLPNLTSYQPPSWSDKIVVARSTNTTSDSPSLTTADQLYVNWAVVNNGSAPATKTFYTSLSIDGTVQNSWSTANLNPNFYTYIKDYAIGSLSAGTHTVTVAVDTFGTITESNESDNTYTETITVAAQTKPDLTKSTDNLNSTTIYAGETATVSAVITNQSCTGGTANAGPFHIGFYWSTSPNFIGVSPFYETAVTGCAANGTVSVNQSLVISRTNSPGTYYLGYKIDDLNEAGECNENNNGIFYWTITVPRTPGGTWIPLNNQAPDFISMMLLLSDGTVMAQAGGNDGTRNWYRLTPDSHGSYTNGVWTSLASMRDTRLYYSSQVLKDGRVLVAGGEYGTGGSTSEIYDPLGNTWTVVPTPPGVTFYDSISEILPNGNVLVAPVSPASYGGTVIYDAVANQWTNGPTLYRGYYQDEASWVKLPDNSILTIDPFGTNSERYIPSLNAWINDGTVPVSLYDPIAFEMGAAFLLPDGRAFFMGATGRTAFYTPTGNTSPGTWTAGPDIPNGLSTPDAAAAMMGNGKILCAVSPPPNTNNHFPPGTKFYEFDSGLNSFAAVGTPSGGAENYPAFQTTMLDLPDGNVLYSSFSRQLYLYHPFGSVLATNKPTISSIAPNGNGSFHLTGTKLNGNSEGAAYGDDAQMNSNYPIIRMTNISSGLVYYARTYNWSSTGVMTGNTPVTTEFTLPASLPQGRYSLCVVANGVSSDVFSFTVYALTVNAGTGGSVSPNGTVMINMSGNQTFTATPNTNYVVDQWFVNGSVAQTGGTNFTVSNVQAGLGVQVTFAVALPKSDQTISFEVLPNKNFGDPSFTLSATASSGLPVSFAIISGPAKISGGSTLNINGTGTVTVRASQAGNASYNAAPVVDRSFTVGKGNQTISFGPLSNRALGEPPFALNATASSGLSVGFNILSGPATVSGSLLTLTNTGTVVVRASQAGDGNYNAAPNVDQAFTIFTVPLMNFAKSPTNVVIIWPTNVGGFTLESTTNLSAKNSWAAVSPSPIILGGQYVVTNGISNRPTFYRLKK